MTTEELVGELRRTLLDDTADSATISGVGRRIEERGNATIAQLDPLLSDSSAKVREGAADVLELIGTEVAYDKLVDFALLHLKDPSQKTKLPGPGWQRLRRLGKSVLPALVRRYDSSLPLDTRMTMIFIAQQIGDPAGRPLVDCALDESDGSLIEAAGEALGVVDGPDAYERLVELLTKDDVHYRLGAVRGLERLKNQAAVRPLLEAVASSDQTIPLRKPSSSGPGRLSDLICDVIESLTGESFDGDTNRIREWLESHDL